MNVVEADGLFYVYGFGYGSQPDGSIGPDKYDSDDGFRSGYGPRFAFPTRELATAAAALGDISLAEGYAQAQQEFRKLLGVKE